MTSWWSVLFAFLACFCFAVIYNVPKKSLFFAALGASVGWAVYLLLPFNNDIAQSFCATLVLSIYAEILARLYRQPATLYIIVAVLPMVPGGGIYYTFKYCLAGDMMMFASSALHTFAIAGVMAMAILFVSSTTRLYKAFRAHHKKKEIENHV